MTALPIGAARTKSGSINEAVVRFFDHASFTSLGKLHQTRHRQVLNKFRQQLTADDVPLGERQLHGLTHQRLAKLVSDMESAHAQRHLLNGLRALMRFCKLMGMVQVDPTDGLKAKRRTVTGGFKTGTEDEIERYRAHHALGTMSRLAFELLLNTGARRGDAIRLGRQHLQAGRLVFKPKKTADRTGMVVNIRIHADLQYAIDAMPPLHVKPGQTTPLTFLTNAYGRAYTVGNFGYWFAKCCTEAGVEFRAHGLRKAICVRLIRRGMSPHQVAAITGHKDLREIQVYAEAYNRELAGDQAMAALDEQVAQ